MIDRSVKCFVILMLISIPFVGYSKSVSVSTTSGGVTGFDINQPYEINGDKFLTTLVDTTRVSKLIGNAKLVLINDGITITANEIWYYSNEKKLVAMKNAMIIKEDKVNGRTTATADHVEYYELEKRAILTGSPKIIQEKSEIKGNKITVVFTDAEPTIEIEGNVYGLLYPKETPPKPDEN